jgi:nitrogen fixation/metabolism regulation signal transduction histidine kinase
MSAIESADPEFLEALTRHVSHQLNNPIASIGSAAYLIEDILTPESEASESIQSAMPFVASIREDATRLKELVDELRRFFVTSNFLPMKVNLTEFVQTRVSRANASGMDVKIELSEFGGPLESDLDLGLMQAAFELLFKEFVAREATQMTIRAASDGNQNTIIFSLPAPKGLTSESAQGFFDPIPFSAGQGLGLTLPYIRKVIEMHSGAIRSRINKTGEFIVEIELPEAQ